MEPHKIRTFFPKEIVGLDLGILRQKVAKI
jgi:hypothetical protein